MMRRLSMVLMLSFMAFPMRGADEVKRLHSLFDRTWEQQLREEPQFATYVGRHEYDDRLASLTPADLRRYYDESKAALAELKSIDRSALPAPEVVNYDMFQRQLVDGIEAYE